MPHPNRKFLEELPIYWAKRRLRNNQPIKLKNFHYIQKFNSALIEVYDEFDEMYDKMKSRSISRVNYFNVKEQGWRLDNLLYSEGSPNFNQFTLTHQGQYAVGAYNPMLHLWKDCEIDTGIIDFYRSLSNTKYEQPTGTIEIEQPYNLFLLQMSRTRDSVETIKAMASVQITKKLTIFKTHPLVGDRTDYHALWKKFKELGLVNEYTRLVDNVHVDGLVQNADLVYSSDSAVTMNAMLLGKPVATYRRMYLSEIVPVLNRNEDLLELKPIPEQDLARWLSWYYHRLVIDLDKDGYKEKIRYIVESYINGKTLEETFGCK